MVGALTFLIALGACSTDRVLIPGQSAFELVYPVENVCDTWPAETQEQCSNLGAAIVRLMDHPDSYCYSLGIQAYYRYSFGDFQPGADQSNSHMHVRMYPDGSGGYYSDGVTNVEPDFTPDWSSGGIEQTAGLIAHEEEHHNGYRDATSQVPTMTQDACSNFN